MNMVRPTKLTPEVQDIIIKAVLATLSLEVAAGYARVSRKTIYNWMTQGAEEEEGIYRDFKTAVEHAMAVAEIRDAAKVADAAERDWRAAAWRLERRCRERWAARASAPDGPDAQGLARQIREALGTMEASIPAPPSPGVAA
jgi:hypothetical protein